MDYSLLVGVHKLNRAKEKTGSSISATSALKKSFDTLLGFTETTTSSLRKGIHSEEYLILIVCFLVPRQVYFCESTQSKGESRAKGTLRKSAFVSDLLDKYYKPTNSSATLRRFTIADSEDCKTENR
jgi:hypothetical protein